MKLTKSLDIALMTLVQLAASGKQLSAAELARTMGAPRNHVAKVIQVLARGGYVRTLRGKGGGIRLIRAPEEVTLKEVIDLVEGPLYLMECMVEPGICPLRPRCRLVKAFEEAQEKMMRVFETTTLNAVLPRAALRVHSCRDRSQRLESLRRKA